MKTSIDHAPAIEADRLVKTFPGDVRALDGLKSQIDVVTLSNANRQAAAEGLRLIHEHHSVHALAPAKGA